MAYSHLRAWTSDDFRFRLDLWDTFKSHPAFPGKSILRYCLFDGDQPLGRGIIIDAEDFACSPLHAIDSDNTLRACIELLAMCEIEDDDRSPFANWRRDGNGEELLNALYGSSIGPKPD